MYFKGIIYVTGTGEADWIKDLWTNEDNQNLINMENRKTRQDFNDEAMLVKELKNKIAKLQEDNRKTLLLLNKSLEMHKSIVLTSILLAVLSTAFGYFICLMIN